MKRWLIAAAVVCLIMGGLGYTFGESVSRAVRPASADRLSEGEALTVMAVGRGSIYRYVTATGNLQPVRRVDLRFSVSGRVEEVMVATGDRVGAGDPLVRLDNRQQELSYLQANANYELARIDAAPNTLQQRRIDRDLAWDALERTILRAPFAGLVTEVRVEPGQSIGTSDIIIQMIDDSAYQVQVSIDELDIGQIAVGQRATVVLDADRGRPRQGAVESIGLVATVSQSMVTVPVTVRLSQVDPLLRPGYTATVQIAVAEAVNVVRIPVESVNESAGVSMVTKVIDGEGVPVPVQTGISDGVWVEIRSGLEPGDQIVGLNYRGGLAGGNFPGGDQWRQLMQNIPGGIPSGIPGGLMGGSMPAGGFRR